MLQLITTKPGGKSPGPSIKNPRVYEGLRRQGMSKQRAARISNAQARKRRHKAYTLEQLEAFVSSPHYDPAIAQAIAARVPSLPRLKGEQISPGVTRIRGNLCNVHGKYGPCDKALSGKKPAKGRKPRSAAKPRQTPEQRAQANAAKRQANADSVAKRMAETDTGLSPSGSKALLAFAEGTQPNAMLGDGLARMGLAERAQDGSYRMTPTGRAAVAAMRAGDYQRAVDAISRGTDTSSARQGRQAEQAKRQQDAAGKRGAAQMGRELRKRETLAKRQARAAEQAKPKPAKAGDKKPTAQAKPAPRRPRIPVRSSGAIPSAGGSSSAPKPKPKPAAPAAPKPEKQQPAVASPALTDAAQRLSDGAELTDADTGALIRNGLARLVKGELVLTATGQRAIRTKSYEQVDPARMETWVYRKPIAPQGTDPFNPGSWVGWSTAASTVTLPGTFKIFKDARGQYRWITQSSTAFQDRDKEIVSTKALATDVARADTDGSYGPLRWWHAHGLDLGDCDFNVMVGPNGRVLFESGTFRSEAIAIKVARAAPSLEISLGFLHSPSEPDAHGVFHHIRRFERSLVPRGKASNRFTAFAVKESEVMDATKVAALKTLGFSDTDIADIEARASATEKDATDQGVAYKADEPAAVEQSTGLPDMVINGVTYKAFPPKAAEEAPVAEAVVEEDAIEDMPMEEEPTEGGLTLSPEDLAAIGEAISAALQQAVATIMGGLDLEKKVAGHVQSFLAPMQATKDAELAETKQQVTQLQSQVAELTGDQPAVPYRPSQAKDNVLTDASLLAATKQTQNGGGPWDEIIKGLGLGQPQP